MNQRKLCASWFFEASLDKVSNKKIEGDLHPLNKILSILLESQIMIPQQLRIQEIQASTLVELIFSDKLELYKFVESTLLETTPDTFVKVYGNTVVFNQNGGTQAYPGFVEITFYLYNHSLTIDFIEDIWTPITKEWQWQIDIAEANAHRLPLFLREIRERIPFSKVYPSEKEVCRDFFRPIKGFKAYILDDDFQWTNTFYPCPPEKLEYVQSFIFDYTIS